MKSRLLAAGLVVILTGFSANAQRRARAPSGRISAAPLRLAPRVSPVATDTHTTGFTPNGPANPPVSVIRLSPSGRTAAAADSFQFSQEDGVPGLGFDYSFLAAVSPALHNPNNGSFGFRHHHQASQGTGFFPIWFGGYPYYDEYGYEQPAQVPQQQPQVIVIQQPVPPQESAEAEAGTANYTAPTQTPQTSAPVADVGEFVLVRKDGRVLFASMYSVVSTQIQYITPEGMRRTLPVSDLDADATQQMNEARGTTVEIHN